MFSESIHLEQPLYKKIFIYEAVLLMLKKLLIWITLKSIHEKVNLNSWLFEVNQKHREQPDQFPKQNDS